MRRLFVIGLCFCLLCVFCGCGKQMTFIPQSGISLNYNNISNSFGVLFDNDGVYYISHDLLTMNIRSIDSSGKHRLTLSSLATSMQKHGETLYWVEDGLQSNDYNLMKYDISAGKKSRVISFTCDSVYDCYLVGEYLYAMTYDTTAFEITYDAVQVSISTGDVVHIAKDIFGCGISVGRFVYLVADNDSMVVYGYDAKNGRSEELGSFEPDLAIDEDINEYVNLTSDSVVLYSDDGTDTKIHVYDFVNDTYSFEEAPSYVYNLIAFEDCAFALLVDGWDENNEIMHFSLHHLKLDTMEFQRLDDQLQYVDIFVTSDHDVYVSASEDRYYHYTDDGVKKNIVIYK